MHKIHNLILLSPESAVSPPWRDIFGSLFFKQHLAVVAIYEAHCIPEWYGTFYGERNVLQL